MTTADETAQEVVGTPEATVTAEAADSGGAGREIPDGTGQAGSTWTVVCTGCGTDKSFLPFSTLVPAVLVVGLNCTTG